MKIPSNAKKVFQGVIFEVYQWDQKLYDGSTAVFESIKRPNTVLVIATKNKKILIAEEEQPGKPTYLTLLGGRQETNEEPLACAKRELLEESGLISEDWELYKIIDSSGKFDWHLYLYIARNCKKVAEPNLDPGEKIKIKTVTFEQFLEIMSEGSGEITLNFLKMRLKPQDLEEFKQKLFKS